MVETKLSECVEGLLASRSVVATCCAMLINAKKLQRCVFNKESMEWLWLWHKIWADVPKRINYAFVAPFAIEIRLTNARHIFVVHVYCYSTPKKIYSSRFNWSINLYAFYDADRAHVRQFQPESTDESDRQNPELLFTELVPLYQPKRNEAF